MLRITKRIVKESAIPYYYQLKELLQEQIENRTLKAGDPLPSEAELCSTFDVSRTVVRQALNELVQGRLIRKEKGKGTFIAKPKLQEKFVQRTYGFYHEMEEKGFRVESKILEQKLSKSPPRIKTLLKLPEKQRVVKISRLRSVNGEIIMLTISYIPSDLCPGLENENLTNCSLYQVLSDKYGLRVSYGYRTLEAVPARKYMANMLKVSRDSPLVYLESIGYLQDGTPIEYFEAWHAGDRCKFAIETIPAEEMKKKMPADKQEAPFWFRGSSREFFRKRTKG